MHCCVTWPLQQLLIQGMKGSRATDTDIMKLVLHWTTLTLHKEMWRKDVMESVTTHEE